MLAVLEKRAWAKVIDLIPTERISGPDFCLPGQAVATFEPKIEPKAVAVLPHISRAGRMVPATSRNLGVLPVHRTQSLSCDFPSPYSTCSSRTRSSSFSSLGQAGCSTDLSVSSANSRRSISRSMSRK